ncbi:MAG: ATP-binding cassette domain-containing protein [Geminicoccaceae bacterium]
MATERADGPILSCRGLTKRFGGVTALSDVSFDLHRGEVLALAGDNGAGKSTLIKAISGVHAPDEGEVVYKGQPIALANPRHAREIGIETIYQDLALADNLDVGANVFLGREPMVKTLGLLPRLDRRRMRAAAAEVLETLEIDIAPNKLGLPVRSLSGGQRQAVAIGRAIYWKAELLIMDEPTAALGVPEQRKVVELIQRLKQQKVAIIFISHNLIDIFAVADRILVLRRGQKAGERRPAETTHDEIVKLMVGAEAGGRPGDACAGLVYVLLVLAAGWMLGGCAISCPGQPASAAPSRCWPTAPLLIQPWSSSVALDRPPPRSRRGSGHAPG